MINLKDRKIAKKKDNQQKTIQQYFNSYLSNLIESLYKDKVLILMSMLIWEKRKKQGWRGFKNYYKWTINDKNEILIILYCFK